MPASTNPSPKRTAPYVRQVRVLGSAKLRGMLPGNVRETRKYQRKGKRDQTLTAKIRTSSPSRQRPDRTISGASSPLPEDEKQVHDHQGENHRDQPIGARLAE